MCSGKGSTTDVICITRDAARSTPYEGEYDMFKESRHVSIVRANNGCGGSVKEAESCPRLTCVKAGMANKVSRSRKKSTE